MLRQSHQVAQEQVLILLLLTALEVVQVLRLLVFATMSVFLLSLHSRQPTKDFVTRVFAQQFHSLRQARFVARAILLRQSLLVLMRAMLHLLR